LRPRHAAGRLEAIILAAALAAAGPAFASGLDLFGFGARSSALAGSGASIADGYDAVYENPSGLARVTKTRLTAGYEYGHFALSIDNSSTPIDDANLFVLGGELPVPFTGALRDRVFAGFGLLVPSSLVARAQVPDPTKPFLMLQDRAQVVGIQFATAVHVLPRLDIGAGLLALAALVGDINVKADASLHINAESELQVTADYAPILGATWHMDSSDIGLVYRGESAASYDVNVANNLGTSLGVGLPKLRFKGVAQYDPRQVEAEMAWRLRPRISLITSLTYKRWSDYPGLAAPPTMNSTPVNQTVFNDTWVGRVAVEWQLAHAGVVRAGYAYEPSPIGAPKNGPTNELDADRSILAAGYGFVYGLVRVDLFTQWHLLLRDQRASGSVLAVGTTVGVDFQ
jgi:long-chain fatty acid transport protein